jgi:type III restriction enzyme
VVEIKGYREEKANTMRACWAPGVNNLARFGRWDFAEFTGVYEIARAFSELIASYTAASHSPAAA